MEIAQPAFAILDVRLDNVAAVTHPLMPRVALAELGGDIFARCTGHHLGLEPAHRPVVQLLVSPDPPCFEQRRPNGDIFFRCTDHLRRRANRLAHLQLQVPEYIEQSPDHLLAPG